MLDIVTLLVPSITSTILHSLTTSSSCLEWSLEHRDRKFSHASLDSHLKNTPESPICPCVEEVKSSKQICFEFSMKVKLATGKI